MFKTPLLMLILLVSIPASISSDWTYSSSSGVSLYLFESNVSYLNPSLVSNISDVWVNSSWVANLVSNVSGDTNESVFIAAVVAGECPVGNYTYGVYVNGSLKCRDDVSGSGGVNTDTVLYMNGSEFLNTSDVVSLNLSYLDDRWKNDTDTTYSALSEFSNDVGFLTSYENLTESDVDSYVSNNGYLTSYENLTESDVDSYVGDNGYVTASILDGVFTSEDNISCTSISGLGASLCDGSDADTTYSALSEFSNDVGFLTSYENLTESVVDSYVANNGYLTSYENLSDADVLGFGYVKLSMLSEFLNISSDSYDDDESDDVTTENLTYLLPQTCSNGQVIKRNGSNEWACATDEVGAEAESDPVFRAALGDLLNKSVDVYVDYESDPLWSSNFSGYNKVDWDTAFGWGDWSGEGFVTASILSGVFTSEDNISCTSISGLGASLCDGSDADTTYSALSEFSNDVGYFDNIANFTGALTSGKWCIYDGSEIDCNVEPIVDTDTTYSHLSNFTNDLSFVETNTNVEFLNVTINGMPFVKLNQSAHIDGEVLGIMQTNPPGVEVPHFVLQSGGSTQASLIARSFMIVNEYAPLLNSVDRTDCAAWASYYGTDLKIDCNTTTTGADLFIGDDLQVVGDMWIQDDSGEYHFMSKELNTLDSLMAGTTQGNLGFTHSNTQLNISNINGKPLVINLDGMNYFEDSTQSVTLNAGTDANPVTNYITFQKSGDNAILTNDAGYPSGISHSDVARIIQGSVGNFYLYLEIPTATKKFIYEVYDQATNNFEKYIEGFNPSATATNLNFTAGEYWTVLSEFDSTNSLNVNVDGFFIVKNDGTFEECSDLTCITNFNDGVAIPNDNYINVIWAVVPDSDNTSRLVAIPSNEPSNDYNLLSEARQDKYNVITYTINHPEITKQKLVLVRTIIDTDDYTFQDMGNGEFYQSIIGLTPAGTSAGGTNDHSLLSNLDYASSGHTGFASQTDLDQVNTTANIEALGFTQGAHTVDTNTDTVLFMNASEFLNTSDVVSLNYVWLDDRYNDTDTNTQLSEDDVEAFIFDEDNDANLNMTGYNVSDVGCIRFVSGGMICDGS